MSAEHVYMHICLPCVCWCDANDRPIRERAITFSHMAQTCQLVVCPSLTPLCFEVKPVSCYDTKQNKAQANGKREIFTERSNP